MKLLFFFIPVFLLMGAIAAYRAHLKKKKRREELSVAARQMGWRFDPRDCRDWQDRYPQFSWFTTGDARYAYNLCYGSIAMEGQTLPCSMGDYTYTVTSGSGDNESTTTYVFSFLLVELPFVGVPDITVRREVFFDRVSAFLGFDDIDFESEEFSRQFHVKSEDKRFAYDLLHPRLMDFLLKGSAPTFQIARNVFCAMSGCAEWESRNWAEQPVWCERFLNMWPRHLLDELQALNERKL